MKFFLNVVCAATILMFSSCSGDYDLGTSIQPSGDGIVLGTDTCYVNSFSIKTGANSSPASCSADSLLLGEFYNATYGTTRGEILAQFTAPSKFSLPAGAVADSLSLTLVFNTWKGSKHSPVQISAYEMDKGTLDYNTTYYTTEDASKYCSKSKLLGSRISVAVPDTLTDTTSYQPHLKYKFSADEVKRFFQAAQDGTFNTQSSFANFFKGIYLRSEYGDGSIWNIHHLYMTLYYKYHAFVSNKDTVLTSGLIFPASKDVRQIGLISHKDIISTVASIPDSVTYITSPAGIYTQVNIPVGRIFNKIKNHKDKNGNYDLAGKVVNFNHSGMTVEVVNRDTINPYALKPPTTLLLTRKANLLNYLKNYNYSSDTLMVATYNSTKHCYTFDLSSMLTAKLHKYYGNSVIPADAVEEMVLVPIEYTLASSSSSTITSIKQQSTLSGVQIRNKKTHNKSYDSPLRINIIYNGF
ncbi:DUF4270 domain-containing protein [Paludibacter jiangxiensis]|uniref:DUF4270 domain-containing protein n=1 Tax=Paludibacter jiangxiensis TaxID=681398 RepID=A0A161LDA9_9BACT|nr:DUF4270 domain-containing protein [Paludibacter jiangxiensis]GAT62115.1 hypothetical protein PJIAN_1705 [Paludibacter jiangxiensis]